MADEVPSCHTAKRFCRRCCPCPARTSNRAPQSRKESTANTCSCGEVGQHRSTLAHGDMVGWVEAHGREIAECADLAAMIFRAKCIAAVFDHPKLVLAGKCHDRFEIKWISKRVRHHMMALVRSLRAPVSSSDKIDLQRWQRYVDKHRHQIVLEDWIDW